MNDYFKMKNISNLKYKTMSHRNNFIYNEYIPVDDTIKYNYSSSFSNNASKIPVNIPFNFTDQRRSSNTSNVNQSFHSNRPFNFAAKPQTEFPSSHPFRQESEQKSKFVFPDLDIDEDDLASILRNACFENILENLHYFKDDNDEFINTFFKFSFDEQRRYNEGKSSFDKQERTYNAYKNNSNNSSKKDDLPKSNFIPENHSKLEDFQDIFLILEISETKNLEIIKRAYRKKALELHPDKNKDRDTKSDFQRLSGRTRELLEYISQNQ